MQSVGGQSYGSQPTQSVSGQSYESQPMHPVGGQSYGSQAMHPVGGQSYGSQLLHPVGGQSYGSQPMQPLSGQSYGGQPMQPLSGQSYGGQPMQPISGQSYESQPLQPVSGQSYGGQPMQPLSGQSYGGQPMQPLSGQSYGGQPMQPISGQSYGSQPLQPVSRQSYGGQPMQPLSGQSYGGQPMQPLSGQSYGGQPMQPLSGQSYGGQPMQLLSGQSYGGQPMQPISGQSYGSQPLQPVSGQSYGGQPMQPLSGQSYGGQPLQPINGQSYGSQPLQPLSGQSYEGQPMMNQPHENPLPDPKQSQSQKSFVKPYGNQSGFVQPDVAQEPASGQDPANALPSVPPSGQQSNKTSGFGRHHSVPNLTEEKAKQTPRRKPTHIAESNPDKDGNNGSRLGQDGDKENTNRQQIKSDPKPNASNADLDSDEWQQVFTFLLREFDGQTKFGTLMSKKDKLLKGLNHAEVAEWLKRNSSKFLVFEKDGKIKCVSICFRGAKICFNYRNPKDPSCKNPKCTYFHVCRDFICESCSYGPECQFSHNFHSQSNIKVCQELGLQNFTNEDIRKIVACSSVSVCDKYNRSGCSKEDCLQLHVCANHVQQKCTAGEGCKLSHSVKSLEHNQWLLQAFHLMQVPDNTISRMVLIRKDEKEKQEKKEMPAGTEDLKSTKSKKEKKGSKEKMKKTPTNDLQKLDWLPMSSPLVPGKPAGVGLSRQHQQDQGERVSLKEDGAKEDRKSAKSKKEKKGSKEKTKTSSKDPLQEPHLSISSALGKPAGKVGLSPLHQLNQGQHVSLMKDGAEVPEDTINKTILIEKDEKEKQEKKEMAAGTEDLQSFKSKKGSKEKPKKTPSKDLLQKLDELSLSSPLVQGKPAEGVGLSRRHHQDQGQHVSLVKDAAKVSEDTISKMILVGKDEENQRETKEVPNGTEALKSAKSKKERKSSKDKMKTSRKDLQETREGAPSPTKSITGSKENVSEKLCNQSYVLPPVQRKLADVQENDPEGGQRQQDAGHYTYLCEMFSCTGDCPTGFLCPRYHHRSQPRYQWQIFVFGFWRDFSRMDNWDIERLYCKLSDRETFEVFVEDVGGLRLTINFEALEAIVEDSHGSDIGASDDLVPVRRWSTRSYVDADPEVALKYFTQWLWFYEDDTGKLVPFQPKRLQHTLEEKYVRGQKKYYYEQGQARFVLHLQEGVRVDLGSHGISKVLRRPALYRDGRTASEISPLLLSEIPRLQHSVPSNWSCVDMYQDFELVELDPIGAEYQDVAHKFHASLDKRRQTILSIFRIQNPALWDKYCSTKRAMTPRDMTQQDVDERQLFHGTPTLDAVRGICANNMDFRRSGKNVGAKYGKGSYFSTNSLYSHSYTCGTDSTGNERYMFLARVLVGKYTPGEESFALPPIREGLKRYDSCVDNQTSPTIFVIFELAQSYPEYLLQYKDTQDADKAASKLGNANSLGSLAVMNKGAAGVTTWAPAGSTVPSARSTGIITDSSKPDLGLLKLPAADMSLPASDTPRSLSGDASSRAPNLPQAGVAQFAVKALMYPIATKAHSAISKDEKCVMS